LPLPLLVNTVMNRLSSVSNRFPAPSSLSMRPACRLSLPSPKIVSMVMPLVMYIMPPASAAALSPGSSSTSTYCISEPSMVKLISWTVRPGSTGGTVV
jgi:hypothetical protein